MKKLTILVLLIPWLGFGQTIKEFPEEPKAFFETLEKFFSETNPEESASIMAEFNVIWFSGTQDLKAEEKMYKEANRWLKKRSERGSATESYVYSPGTQKLTAEQKSSIIRTCASMLKKRMKAFPDFKNYIHTILSFQLSNQSAESFSGWQASLDKLLEKKNKYYASYINGCNDLFAANLLYNSASTRWSASNNRYTFDFDTLPKVVFAELDLVCHAKRDSSVIIGTKGSYYPTLRIWSGEGGKVLFTRSGYKEEEAHAKLRKYSIDVTGADYTADSADLYFSKYFDKPLMGLFGDRLLADVTPENASYPRFSTFAKILEINDIVPDVDFIGGLKIEGRKIIGLGTGEEPARLTFYFKKNPFLQVWSNTFVIREEKISSDRTMATFYLDTAGCNTHCDSIFHPSAQFKYVVKDRQVSLIRSSEGVSNSPFFDSFHNLDLHVEGIFWNIDSTSISMKSLTGDKETKARFESASFYQAAKYDYIQGLSDTHPFTPLKRYTKEIKSRIVETEDYALYVKMPPDQIRALFMGLSNSGFLKYNSKDNNFYVTDRVFFYIDAKAGNTDYDALQFLSIPGTKSDNARMDIHTYNLSLYGVSQVLVSDSQQVMVTPKGRELTVTRNRDFSFTGKVSAGRFEYYGSNFAFDYDQFMFNLTFIDSMRMKIPGKEKDAMGNTLLVPVKSVIQYINGNLLIDQPGNKSGRKDFNEYPVFNSFKDSYVFYNKSSIQKGVYIQDNFFFNLEPFSIDSLNTFDPSALGLKGNFVSAGIFPDFQDVLKIQPDYSLGFVRTTPENGFPAYGGKGTYSDTIKLSNEGLKGSGVLNYVTSVSKSSNFVFLPDSMNAYVREFEIKKQGKPIEFPDVSGMGVIEHWRPYKDFMNIYKYDEPIVFYKQEMKFEGVLTLSPEILTGNGIASFIKADLIAKHFKFKETSFNSDTADFNLKTEETAEFAFKTINVQSEIDFVSRTGTFKSNGGATIVEFPANQYMCHMDQFKWFMDEKFIELGMGSKGSGTTSAQPDSALDTNLDLEGSEFISTNPDQDSLRWVAPYARYFLKEALIKAEEVKFMLVADAVLIPDSGKVTVKKKAKLETFTNAGLTVNSTTKYHKLHNVTADVLGRKNYVASGDYDYEDIYKKKQTIHFAEIKVDTTVQTYAICQVPDSIKFTLIPQIGFKGEVILNASKQFLVFSGYSRLTMQCENVSGSWFRFSSEINPSEVYIPLDSSLINDQGERLSASVSLFNDSASFLYTTFMGPRRTQEDVEILKPSGYLFYAKESNEFRIAPKEKLLNKSLPGNSMVFNDTKCLTYGEGKLDFGIQSGLFKITSPGVVTMNTVNNKSTIETMMLLDFFFDDAALKEMADNIEGTATLVPADNNRGEYEKGLSEILTKELAGKLITEQNLYGSFSKLPKELNISLFLTQVKFEWNEDARSFRSEGPISVGNVGKSQLNKVMQGQIEIQKKKSGDVFVVYLEADPSNWYFFRYTRGVMEAVSSRDRFNNSIKNLKAEKRQLKGEKDQGNYEFLLSSDKKKNDFLRKLTEVPEEE